MNAVIAARPEPTRPDVPLKVTEGSRKISPVVWGICALLFFAVFSFGAVETWSISILESGLAFLFLTWAAAQLVSGEVKIKSSALYGPVLLFGAGVGLQLALNRSVYRYATSIAALEYLAYGLLIFLTTQYLNNSRCSKGVVWAFTFFGVALALFAIAQNLTFNGKIYWVRVPRNGGAIFGPYVNRDHYAGLMEMLFPVPVVLSLSNLMRGPKRVLVGFGGVVMAGSIVLSQSRAGTAAFLIEMAVLVGLLWGTRKDRRVAVTVGIVCLTVMAFAAWAGTAGMWNHFTHLQDWMRLAIARDGLRMFWHRPVLGWGLGTFTTVYPQYQSFYTDLFVNAAHNDYVQALVETGIVGAVSIVWFVIATYREGLRNLDSWNRDWSRVLGLAALIGCTGILVHSAFDFNLQIPANACIFYFLCAVATSTASLPASPRSRRSTSKVLSDIQ